MAYHLFSRLNNPCCLNLSSLEKFDEERLKELGLAHYT